MTTLLFLVGLNCRVYLADGTERIKGKNEYHCSKGQSLYISKENIESLRLIETKIEGIYVDNCVVKTNTTEYFVFETCNFIAKKLDKR